jgi:ATP-dependent DNA ligase
MDYRSGERDGMQKIKNFRSADCVVGGFRYGTSSKMVGSLLLGLYNGKGLLDHVGFTSSIIAADRPELTKKLEPLIEPPGFTGNAPGGPSRWSRGKEKVWQPLKP